MRKVSGRAAGTDQLQPRLESILLLGRLLLFPLPLAIPREFRFRHVAAHEVVHVGVLSHIVPAVPPLDSLCCFLEYTTQDLVDVVFRADATPHEFDRAAQASMEQ